MQKNICKTEKSTILDFKELENEIEKHLQLPFVETLEDILVLEERVRYISNEILYNHFKDNEILMICCNPLKQDTELFSWIKLFLFHNLIENDNISIELKTGIEAILKGLFLNKISSKEKKLYFNIKRLEIKILLTYNGNTENYFNIVEYMKKNIFYWNKLTKLSCIPQILRKQYLAYIEIGELYSRVENKAEAEIYYDKALKEYNKHKNDNYKMEDYFFILNHIKENRI